MGNSKKEAEALIPTDWGEFKMMAYTSDQLDYAPNIAMVHPDLNPNDIVPVRIHSECLTGDLFHSQRCDCGNQLDAAMRLIAKTSGVVIYLRQEGRGIGIINKLHAYNKQDEGMDTIEANLALGLEIDSRKYADAVDILKDLGISKIKLLTNNPDKINAFDNSGIEVLERVSLQVEINDNNRKYLKTKQDSLGHFLNVK
ncbi:MAG: GTP cyclohydrolase II [Saprospiraceae bacterium]|nr:GTP cyclohydrolase II [Saprospiraceae bacterium]NNL91095.1 GTP cyclohydrolase II [Saprospiraceae bacterium]